MLLKELLYTLIYYEYKKTIIYRFLFEHEIIS